MTVPVCVKGVPSKGRVSQQLNTEQCPFIQSKVCVLSYARTWCGLFTFKVLEVSCIVAMGVNGCSPIEW